MGHATDQTPAQPTPQERVAALQQQAAADFAEAQARRDALNHEDRVNGMVHGSAA